MSQISLFLSSGFLAIFAMLLLTLFVMGLMCCSQGIKQKNSRYWLAGLFVLLVTFGSGTYMTVKLAGGVQSIVAQLSQ